jgi:polysaccharide chain length determinant protein (PEP-CTERM system associated)
VIPGKTYKPEDVVEAAWRRRWIIVGPFVLIAVASVIVAAIQPDRYRSEALLQIVPQQVPQDYVRSAVTVPLDSRLQAILQQILSRTQLERIVQEFNLYPDERKRMLMEDVIERMRSKHVLIGGVPNGRINSSAFRVGFEAGNPKTAMLVAERLASLFINANLQDRSVFADQTDQFLQNQLAETRRQLKEYETKLEEFRKLNPGRMPGELQNNQQALGNVQSQVQALQESINRDRDRQLMLQRMIADAAAAPPPPAPADGAPMPAARQLEQERTRLRNMQMRLKPNHPDIGIQQRIIRDLEQKATAEAMQQPVSATVSSAGASRVSELQAESDALDRRVASKQEDEKRLMATMSMYRQRVESAPSTESRLTELMRDYTTLQGTYQNLLSKSQEAKVAANLERQQIGEQFKVLDSARIPQRPSTPNRPLLILIGSLLGLGCGVALAALLEYRDKSLRSDDDVIVALSLPVLARVPTMTTAAERRRQKRFRLMLASSGALAVVLCVATIAWKFHTIADWIR